MIAHSSSSSGPGLLMIASGMAILPMSCSSAPSSVSRCAPPRSTPELLGDLHARARRRPGCDGRCTRRPPRAGRPAAARCRGRRGRARSSARRARRARGRRSAAARRSGRTSSAAAGASTAAIAASRPIGREQRVDAVGLDQLGEHHPRGDAQPSQARAGSRDAVGGELRRERGEVGRPQCPSRASGRRARRARPRARARSAASLKASRRRSGATRRARRSAALADSVAERDEQRHERRRQQQQHRHEHELGRREVARADPELEPVQHDVPGDEGRGERQVEGRGPPARAARAPLAPRAAARRARSRRAARGAAAAASVARRSRSSGVRSQRVIQGGRVGEASSERALPCGRTNAAADLRSMTLSRLTRAALGVAGALAASAALASARAGVARQSPTECAGRRAQPAVRARGGREQLQADRGRRRSRPSPSAWRLTGGADAA